MKNIDSLNSKPKAVPPKVKISSGEPKLNLLMASQPRSGRKVLKKILWVIVIVILILGGAVFFRAESLSQKIFVGKTVTIFSLIKDAFGGSGTKLVGEDLGQINILLLGIGGEGHDGPYLSDTMILAQIRPDIGTIAMVSIPRDYWATLPNGGQGKINEAFSDGYLKNHDWNEGGQWATQAAEKLSGLQIPYFAVLDFSGFEKAINQVGGVDVNIENTFTDYSYPNDATNGYLPPLTFTAGWEHMDGTRALEFARSRHAAGIEGSDFARGLRQQKIISAFKDKVLNLNLIKDAGTINSLMGTFADHFHTNLSPAEILHIYDLSKQQDIKNFISLSLDPSTSLVCPVIRQDTGAYTLEPCDGKTTLDIENFFKNVFTLGKITAEKSVVWLSTSTGDRAAYNAADTELKQAGLTVWELPYKGQALSQNIFYQANPKPATAEFIKNTLNATEATLPPPGVKVDNSKVDVIVILGASK